MSGEAALVQVHLLGVPLQTRTRYLQHLDALVRELALLRIGAQQHPESFLPPRLLRVAAELRSSYAPYQPAAAAVMEAALAAGEDSCDVTYLLPLTLLPLARDMAAALEEADDFCRREQHLLTLPATPEVVAYRRWLFGEFQRQLAGQGPRAWRRPAPHPPGPAATTTAADPAAAALVPAAAPLAPAQPVAAVAEPRSAEHVPTTATASADHGGEVVGEPLVMESVAGSVAVARRHVRQVLTRLGAQVLEESAELGVSELVTNAILHAQTPFTLTVRVLLGGRVRIDVTDSSPSPVQLRHFGVAASTGRGLQLVASTSSAWGIEELAPQQGPGKTVWFEPAETVAGEETGFDAGDWNLEDLL